jgi:hypothetical protein
LNKHTTLHAFYTKDEPITYIILSFFAKVSYIITMTVEQIIDIPVDRRITLEIPQTIPIGKTILSFTPIHNSPSVNIEEVRQLLHKEMAEQGTLSTQADSGDGWTAHVTETYAKH